MPNTKDLERRVKQIEERNKKVGSDKEWELSITRKVILALIAGFMRIIIRP